MIRLQSTVTCIKSDCRLAQVLSLNKPLVITAKYTAVHGPVFSPSICLCVVGFVLTLYNTFDMLINRVSIWVFTHHSGLEAFILIF